MTKIKDLRVIAVVVNNQLRERREAILDGEQPVTRAELARRIGITPMDYGDYEALKVSPLDGRKGRVGKWRASARDREVL